MTRMRDFKAAKNSKPEKTVVDKGSILEKSKKLKKTMEKDFPEIAQKLKKKKSKPKPEAE